MKLNSLLLILAAGLAGVAVTSCGGSNGNSQPATLTPQATAESTPAGSTIASDSTVAVGCASNACTLYVPTGSGFQSFDAPSDIQSASEIASVQYQSGSILVVSTSGIAYVSTNVTSNNLGSTPYSQVTFPLPSSLFAVLISAGEYGISSGVSQSDGLVGGNVASTESAVAIYASGSEAKVCYGSSTSSSTTALAGTASNVAGAAYAGVGLSSGQVCVFNTSTRTFTNLTSGYAKAQAAYTSSAQVNGIAFYQNGTSCSGYWYNSDGTIWGVNATCGTSTVTPLTFTQLSSTTSVSGNVPQSPTAIYVDQTNGLWVGGSIAGFAVVYYLTAGTNSWTYTPIYNSSGNPVQGTVSALSASTSSGASSSTAVATVAGTSYSLIAATR